MKRVVSYRRKIIELAKIYKIEKVLDPSLKLTTYEIEIELLRNKVPIPSRRGYFSHKIHNEILQPIYSSLEESLSIVFNLSKNLKILFNNFKNSLTEKLSIDFSLYKNLKKNFTSINIFAKEKQSINFSLNKSSKKLSNWINNYLSSIVSNISNFFKVLSKTTIDGLNDVYHFKVEEKLIKKYILRGLYSSLVITLVAGGLLVKDITTDVDGLKISLETKVDKKNTARAPNDEKTKKNKNFVKKQDVEKKPYDPENDYTLNTQTVLNLFEDLEYDLDKVRNKKLVKPIYFTRLPKDLDLIKSVTQKKETFLQILLPLVVAENESIKKDRKYLLKILKQNQSQKNINWINKKFKKYKVSKKNVDELIEKIDVIPTSIALAQAAKESGWGTSRFALEGNAIFGQWTWNGVGMAPLDKDEDQKHKILKFPLLRASVKAYIANLNTHAGYKNFRKKRAILRAENKNLSGLDLIHELENYAQTGKEYTRILEKIIKQNDLDEFETVTIDDFKEENELKL
jgi:Bax protein